MKSVLIKRVQIENSVFKSVSLKLPLKGLQKKKKINNPNPHQKQKRQTQGSSRSPGHQDDGSLIGEWRWVGGRVHCSQLARSVMCKPLQQHV